MDFETWQKVAQLAFPLFLGVCTIYVAFRQFLLGTKSSYREEYKFAKSFFDDLNAHPQMHKYARHKGYQAIIGSRSFPTEVVEYLMHTTDPVRSVNDYRISRSYLDHKNFEGRLKLKFGSDFRFSKAYRRKFWLIFYAVTSILFYLFAFLPFFYFSLKVIPSSIAFSLSVFTFPVGIYGTFVFAFEYVQLHIATTLLHRLDEEERLLAETRISGEEHD